MTDSSGPPNDGVAPADDAPDTPAACVLAFNTVDPSGAGGLAADVLAIGSIGGHALPVATGALARDTRGIQGHFPLGEDAVAEQARAVLEDMPVRVIKVGFAGTPDVLGAIAGIAADYPDLPLVAHMPDLSWWTEEAIDDYLDAFRELLLPQVTVLAGNHSTLRRWLLPDWSGLRNPGPRDLARAASTHGVPYTVVTGVPGPGDSLENQLATPQALLASERFERFEATFIGAGDTFTAALAALLATGHELATAFHEAAQYLDDSLDAGYRPGMGHVLPDRLFWAEGGDDAADEAAGPATPYDDFDDPANETRH